jgi:1-acyl-sn-glycerol-3-phosphate acyltransferase
MNLFVAWFCKIFIKPIVGLLFIKEVKGLENIPQGNFILASNHQSHLDWIVCGWLCVPRRFTYLGQIDRYSGLLSLGRNLLYFVAGVIPVNRGDENSKKMAVEKAIEALKKGKILVIYPEGTRSRTGEIQKGKFGTAKIFLKTGVPILPVAIKGTFEIFPPGKGFPKIKKVVKVNIGKPLYFKEELKIAKNLNCDSEDYKNFLGKITDKIMEEIYRLYEEEA